MSMMRFKLRCIAISLAFVWRAAALVENRTIDDGDGDEHTHVLPEYRPVDRWKFKDCPTCAIHPDVSQTHGSSWHAGLYMPDQLSSLNILFPFEGTALYVYFILANGQNSTTIQDTAVNFTLDDNPAGSFTHIGEAGKGLQYRALVYHTTGLNQTQHSFFIESSGASGKAYPIHFHPGEVG
ncbi:hypothetical protein CYLTODRAFT_451750 [Cylindrobasidium torrendii FP15055 ss-10]|uniref:Uncharacterized protein n=1 Tax=Cylindrobasidium torrendii FP15055 ss-10 TaxID=1314674 RepID=A0A0D7BLG3_9AGAR|nr:hypothetical protein CYLTODRAFT_451750 [Cylindrobasidium torrendii FP15055 ss-10]